MGGGVSKEQIARAKAVRIDDYILTNEPGNVRRVGKALYLKDHGSLEISNGLWNWHSRGVGGRNAVDYLMKVRGYGFVDAVRKLAGGELQAANARPPPQPRRDAQDRRPFSPPPRNGDNGRVIEYLTSRGIDRDIILGCIRDGILYETAGWHNCCFVGRDDGGRARNATLRGTSGAFRRDADGSDKRHGFRLPPDDPGSGTVLVFESPIDLLSHDTLAKLGRIEKTDGWRLSLGGTATAALTHLIETRKNDAPITRCVVCTDGDAAGERAYREIKARLDITVTRLAPDGKDWNEALQKTRKEARTMKDARKDIRFIDSHYKELFRIKDGESVKLTVGHDGEEKTLRCRHIDEAHVRLIGNYHNDYHIRELAEKTERAGNKIEPIPGQGPTLDVIAARYGDDLADATIPMTEDALGGLVGGIEESEKLHGASKEVVFGLLLRGKDGMAVTGLGADGETPTSLHPYWAQKLGRELSPARRAEPKEATLLGEVAVAGAQTAARGAADRQAQGKDTGAR